MNGPEREARPHIIVSARGISSDFRPVGGGGSEPKVPDRDRGAHGQHLLAQLRSVKAQLCDAVQAQSRAELTAGRGLAVHLRSKSDSALAVESLARESSHIELLNASREEVPRQATVFVPEGKLEVIEGLVTRYLDEGKDRYGNPQNRRLLDPIDEIRPATLEDFWGDDLDLLPEAAGAAVWWEVWLSAGDDPDVSEKRFRALAAHLGFTMEKGTLVFPERVVLLMNGTRRRLEECGPILNSIAELRLPKETAAFFSDLSREDQRGWAEDLLGRATYPARDSECPYVCILDTGANAGHPLLAPALDQGDLHTIEPTWGSADVDGHGTEMAGLALYGDLTDVLASRGPVPLAHFLESVKLLHRAGVSAGSNYGYLTEEAVSRPEVSQPSRSRVFSMAVTATDGRDRGRPSAWSAAVDKLASDADHGGEQPRLIVVSGGNASDPAGYPDSNSTDSIHDPGQAWNALTVGAYTEKAHGLTGGPVPIAEQGGLSPFSTTSVVWNDRWPLKPDVLFEGGNAARDSLGAWEHPDLSLLSTYYRPPERLFTTTGATSAASALCSRMAALLMAHYPHLWPETIRGLIVHSAEWTEPMHRLFWGGGPPTARYRNLVRHCGHGVPDTGRAMWSMSNSLTLVTQDELQPFKRGPGKQEPKLCEMRCHHLPWPLDELEELGDTQVRMRVTLSYFVEPSPASRGFGGKYSYPSHRLSFDVRRPEEKTDDFRARINDLDRSDDYRGPREADAGWQLGSQLRHRGSLHQDTWEGSAAQLARRGVIAVYPSSGWWKTRKRQGRCNRTARYALLVSIRAPETQTDLYTPVDIKNRTAVSVEIPR